MLVVHFKDGREQSFGDVEPEIVDGKLRVGHECFSLGRVNSFGYGGKDYFVYTGAEYVEQLRLDYEDFAEEAGDVDFSELDENTYWGSGKQLEESAFVVCDGMMEMINTIIT